MDLCMEAEEEGLNAMHGKQVQVDLILFYGGKYLGLTYLREKLG